MSRFIGMALPKSESGIGMINEKVVSFNSEMLIVVDEDDNILDYKSKVDCHQGDGILHRAFSIFIFNSEMKLLLQKRSDQKLLWPLFWSNTCCSHPRKGETMDMAIHRRLREEIGFDAELKYLYKFIYQANFSEIGAENELCSVYIGKSEDSVGVNDNEIAEWRYISIADLTSEISENSQLFTPWLKMEWDRLISAFKSEIETL